MSDLPNHSLALHNGRMTLFRDDTPLFGHMFCPLSGAKAYSPVIDAAVAAGVPILVPFCGMEDWQGYGTYDFSGLGALAEAAVRRNPDILFLPRYRVYAPAWWAALHPEEMPKDALGEDRLTPSIHSVLWRTEILQPLEAFCRFCQTPPLRGRVIGIQLGAGGLEEWRVWTDYSVPTQTAFAAWLRERYGTDEALREAWRDATIRLDSRALVPPPAVLKSPGALGLLRDPIAARRIADWWEFHNRAVPETLDYFCGKAKEFFAPQRIIAGGFYGYHFWLNGLYGTLHECGHAGLGHLVHLPHIDYVVGLPNYDTRQPGQAGPPMGMPATLQHFGKAYLSEIDIRTHVAGGSAVTPFLNPAETEDASVGLVRREWARCVADGSLFWYFDMRHGWFDTPGLRAEQRLAQRFGSELLAANRESVAQWAVVSDEATTRHQANPSAPGHAHYYQMYQQIMDQLWRAGAPFDTILPELLDESASRYRLLVFPMMAWADETRLAMIDRLKTDGRTLVFCWAPGVIGPEGVSIERMRRLTGVHLALAPSGGGEFQTTAAQHPLLKRLGAGWRLCSPTRLEPCVTVADADAVRLARNPGSDATVIAARDFGTWRSVFVQYPFLPPEFWADCLDWAGVHPWSPPGDTVMANASMVALHASRGGAKTITLPWSRDVVRWPGESQRQPRTASVSFDASPGETAIFRLF